MLNRKNNYALANCNPFREMDEFEKHFFGEPFNFFRNDSLSEFKTDIKDEGDAYTLEMDLPGFAKEDISLDIENDVLTIQAQRHSEHEEKDKQGKYLRCERSYGSYSRSFDLSAVKAEGIKAKYENGVLTLHLPKKEAVLPASKHLEIE